MVLTDHMEDLASGETFCGVGYDRTSADVLRVSDTSRGL